MKHQKIKLIILAFILLICPISVSSNEYEENETVILGGEPFGIKIFCEGVMVVKLEGFETENGVCCPAEKAGIKINDVILSANGKNLSSNTMLNDIITNSQGKEISLKIKRNEKELNIEVKPQKNINNEYKLGIWVKDSTAGIGTITFYSQELSGFCGLGHGICDSDSGGLIPLYSGDVDMAYVASVTKSNNGDVGSLEGYFTSTDIGAATINTNSGIYGTIEQETIQGTEIQVANKNEVTLGKASIYTTINGSEPEEYEIIITRIDKNNETLNMVIEITDKELLDVTGGIVQGMSGSPIVQNNKLVGAVTHVLIDNVNCGYGIFAETMLENLSNYCH